MDNINNDLYLIQQNLKTLNILLVLIAYIISEICYLPNRRWHVRPMISEDKRLSTGAYYKLHTFFRLEDHEQFQHYLRMPEKTFAFLYEKLRERLTKKNTRLRKSLSPELRLAAVLS